MTDRWIIMDSVIESFTLYCIFSTHKGVRVVILCVIAVCVCVFVCVCVCVIVCELPG